MELNIERDKKVFELMRQIKELTNADTLVIQSGCQQWSYNPNSNEGTYSHYNGIDEPNHYTMTV